MGTWVLFAGLHGVPMRGCEDAGKDSILKVRSFVHIHSGAGTDVFSIFYFVEDLGSENV